MPFSGFLSRDTDQFRRNHILFYTVLTTVLGLVSQLVGQL
jgi:hypothetical protein